MILLPFHIASSRLRMQNFMQNYVYLFVWYYCRYCAFGLPTDINIH